MKDFERLCLIITIILLCGCQGPDLKPTVKLLAETIKTVRTKDYEKGRVKFSEDESRNNRALKARLERLNAAESLAEEALKDE